jgi:hypothetical protein
MPRRVVSFKFPDELIVDLKAYAARERRSVSGAAEFLISTALEVFRRQRPIWERVDRELAKVGSDGASVGGAVGAGAGDGLHERDDERNPDGGDDRQPAGGGQSTKPRRK